MEISTFKMELNGIFEALHINFSQTINLIIKLICQMSLIQRHFNKLTSVIRPYYINVIGFLI